MINDEKLMRYLDGELSPVESREVERELSGSPELAKKRDALLEMRDILRARYEIAEEDAEPQLVAMWERVRSGIPGTARPARKGVWTRARDWMETYRSHFVTGLVAAAAGAVVATFVTSRLAGSLATGAPAAESAEVESLEVLGGSGMVFQEPGDKKGAGSTVIWVTTNEPNDDDDTPLVPKTLDPPPPATPTENGGTL